MIVSALRATGNLADGDLALGIEKNLIHIDKYGVISPCVEKATPPSLKVVK